MDTSARLQELGRQPYSAREFLIKNADRVLWGTDYSTPNQKGGYSDWFRFLETKDEFFASAGDWPMGWKLYGVGLPDDVLRKIYGRNAARLLNIRV